MTLDTWRETGEFSQHRGHRIFYRDAGSGEAVVCIHGFPTASWDWHRVWPRLCEEFRLIAPDMLGFGFSDKPAGYGYSIHDQADLIEEFFARAVGKVGARTLVRKVRPRGQDAEGHIRILGVA